MKHCLLVKTTSIFVDSRRYRQQTKSGLLIKISKGCYGYKLINRQYYRLKKVQDIIQGRGDLCRSIIE